MPLAIAPATVLNASAKPLFGYATVGLYVVACATRSIVAIAPRLVALTKARCGRPAAGLPAIASAAARSCAAAAPLFGLAKVYVDASWIAGTPLTAETSARGVSP